MHASKQRLVSANSPGTLAEFLKVLTMQEIRLAAPPGLTLTISPAPRETVLGSRCCVLAADFGRANPSVACAATAIHTHIRDPPTRRQKPHFPTKRSRARSRAHGRQTKQRRPDETLRSPARLCELLAARAQARRLPDYRPKSRASASVCGPATARISPAGWRGSRRGSASCSPRAR
jgi:hypothetical protein